MHALTHNLTLARFNFATSKSSQTETTAKTWSGMMMVMQAGALAPAVANFIGITLQSSWCQCDHDHDDHCDHHHSPVSSQTQGS